MPVISATQEAEAGELLEPRRRRLWWAQIAPLHSSLGNKSEETPSQKKKEIIKLKFYEMEKNMSQAQWLIYTIPATQEAEMRGLIIDWGQ